MKTLPRCQHVFINILFYATLFLRASGLSDICTLFRASSYLRTEPAKAAGMAQQRGMRGGDGRVRVDTARRGRGRGRSARKQAQEAITVVMETTMGCQ